MTKDEECLKRVKGWVDLEMPNCLWIMITATPNGESALITSHAIPREHIVGVLEAAVQQIKDKKVRVGAAI